MNNYHLFLIRTDIVTQLGTHLLAGILALVLFFGLSAPKSTLVSDSVRPARVVGAVLAPGTMVVAANAPSLR